MRQIVTLFLWRTSDKALRRLARNNFRLARDSGRTAGSLNRSRLRLRFHA
jgi:hypothetical protein